MPPGPVEGRTQEQARRIQLISNWHNENYEINTIKFMKLTKSIQVTAEFERATVVRRGDNLALEGDRDFATTTSKEYRAMSATAAGKARAVRRRTWTKQGGIHSSKIFTQFVPRSIA